MSAKNIKINSHFTKISNPITCENIEIQINKENYAVKSSKITEIGCYLLQNKQFLALMFILFLPLQISGHPIDPREIGAAKDILFLIKKFNCLIKDYEHLTATWKDEEQRTGNGVSFKMTAIDTLNKTINHVTNTTSTPNITEVFRILISFDKTYNEFNCLFQDNYTKAFCVPFDQAHKNLKQILSSLGGILKVDINLENDTVSSTNQTNSLNNTKIELKSYDRLLRKIDITLKSQQEMYKIVKYLILNHIQINDGSSTENGTCEESV